MILLDTSASSLNQQALNLTKGVIIGLGESIYSARQRLSLIQFGNNQVNTVCHHTRPPKNIQQKIDAITAGGGTPLRSALLHAQKQLKDIRKRHPNEWQSLYIFTDGRSQEPYTDINFASDTLVFIDTELNPISLARSQTMAQFFNAEYVRLTDIPLKDHPY